MRCGWPLGWPFRRETAWRLIKQVMIDANVPGSPACPRGLRHAFGVGALQSGIPLNLAQRWLGHARISTTAIYADVAGPEELMLAERFWKFTDADTLEKRAIDAQQRSSCE